ncbi:MAG: hypothetical protein GY774_14490 [Planctomycetes bacterium]|nr:hypothetical protein [Planctomycetota bacterium]
MAEELSPELKLYVKEEIEKVRKENREEVEKVKSKATKTFTTVVIVVGLLTGLGVYGLAANYIDTAIQEGLGEDTLEKIKEHETQAKSLRDDIDKIHTTAETTLSELKTELEKHQVAAPNGYACIGDIKFVWGTRQFTKQKQYTDDFEFVPPNSETDKSDKYNFNECFTVIPNLPGRVTNVVEKGFSFDRHDAYQNDKYKDFTFVAIGN